MSWGAGQPALLLIYVTCIDDEITGVRMSTIYDDAPSKILRYNESQAFIKAAAYNRGDEVLGRKGFAHYKNSEDRWYFREELTDDYRVVQFDQIAFVPMIGDKILVGSEPGFPSEYVWSRHNSLNDAQSIEDRTVMVTDVAWVYGDDYSQGSVVVTGEVKSRQKPDDTEQVKLAMPGRSTRLPWTFAESVVVSPESETRATLFHEFHNVSVRLWEETRMKRDYSSDIDLIGTMLVEEANSRGWCSEYDYFVDKFNSDSKVATIDPREKEYDVTVDVTVTMTVPITICVTARSEEDAEQIVNDDASSYIHDSTVESEVHGGDWGISIDDYNVSEVNES